MTQSKIVFIEDLFIREQVLFLQVAPSPRLPMSPHQCRAGACSRRKRPSPAIPTATTFVLTYPTKYRTLFRFFLEKRRNQKMTSLFRYAETGECFALPWFKRRLYFRRAEVVGTLPGFRCPSVRAAVYDFLPLRHRDEMRSGGRRLSFSRPHAIGHRYM